MANKKRRYAFLDPIYSGIALTGPPLRFLERIYTKSLRTLSPEEVAKQSERLKGCELYHFQASPYSARVRLALARLQVEIPMHDVLESKQAWEELMAGGMRDAVPCLKISEPGKPVRWMYQSLKIVKYLEERMA